MSIHTKSKDYYNGCLPRRVDQQISSHISIEITNNESNYIAILFHSFPGPFVLTSYTNNDNYKRKLFIDNAEAMKYFYYFKPTDKLITIESDKEEFVSFSIFTSEVGCVNEDDYFVTSKPNQTLVFKKDIDENSHYKLNSKSRKCVLIDSGGTMSMQLEVSNESTIKTYFNYHQHSNSEFIQSYSVPLFYSFFTDELQEEDQVKLSYQSSTAYDHQYHTGETNKSPSEDKNTTGVVRIDITVAIISGLFIVFIFMTIIGLRRMRRMADDHSEDEGQTEENISVYEPESNEEVERKVQYPKKFSSDEEYSLSEDSDNNVKEIVCLPPKDVFNMNKEQSDLIEESEQNETEEDNNDGNPYNHDATLTL